MLSSLSAVVRARVGSYLRSQFAMLRSPRLLWPGCGLLLALLVSFALPGQRIQLGASQLKGLVGSYTGHGNWLIQPTYSGSCTVTTTANNGAGNHTGSIYASIGGHGPMTNETYDLSAQNTPPSITDTGGISTGLSAFAQLGMMGIGSQTMRLSTDSAKLHFQLTWMPENGDAGFDPPPSKLAVFYRIGVTADTSAGTHGAGDHAQADSSVSCGEASTSATSTADGGGGSSDQEISGTNYTTLTGAQFVEKKLSASSGSASLDFNINMVDSVNGSTTITTNSHQGDSDANFRVDFCVAGFNMSRFGPGMSGGGGKSGGGGGGGGGGAAPENPGLGGGKHSGSSDPTFTRWLPLAFSPQISSQPFRFQAGALPGPWGNINCMYSLRLAQEPVTPNLDLDGEALELQPSFGSGPGAPFTPYPGSFTPKYALTDATGDRLLFNANWIANGDVYSTLSNNGGYYYLTNAGPPGSLRSKGDYTYTFQKTSGLNQPVTARLIAIQDNLGNTQTVSWGANNAFTVTDSSSGRSLVFNAGANGYIGSVDAPETATTIHTHTALTWDGSGHCTAINVYAGGTTLLLHSDVFGYGGPNGDSVTSEQQGVSAASFVYGADPTLQDPFGLPTPRLTSATYGSSGDSSSSDDGGSVAGTYSYTYGPMQHGYNWWGISAHTNTTMDARGTAFSTIFQLAGDVYGPVVGWVSQGPPFAGSPATNQTRTAFSPSMDQPQLIRYFDQLFNAGQNTLPWQATLDLLGNLTSFSDPLGHTWQFGYSDDGKYLTSTEDPVGLGITLAYGERNNAAGLLTTASAPATGTTQIDYNGFGQPITVKSTASSGTAQTSLAYANPTGDLAQVVGPTGDALTVTGYDALGDPTGVAAFPDTGNPATSTQALVSSVVWDAAQLPAQSTMANGVQSVNTWNNGILTQMQCRAPVASGSGLLAQLTFGYDTRGRLYQASDTLGTLIGYKYDKNGNVTRVLDAAGHGPQFVYGSNNEFTGMWWADGVHHTSATYDAAGRVRQTTDERGVVCNLAYDTIHELTDVQWPATPAENVHYTYDVACRLVSAQDSSGSRTYEYDTSGRLWRVTTVLSGLPVGSNTYALVYSFNPDGSVSSMVSPVGTTQYQYNAAGEPTQLSDPRGNVTTWNYDHVGRPLAQSTTGAGTTLATTYTWGVSGLAGDASTAPAYLRQIAQTLNGQNLATYTLTHDYLGLLLGVQSVEAGGASRSGQYAYDARGRLTAQQTLYHANPNATVSDSGSYSYDATGHLNAGANGWQYNVNGQLTSAPVAGGLPGASGLTYDAAGHLTSINGLVLSYDCWGRLAQIANTPAGTVQLYYDSGGRRVCKQVGGVQTFYLYDGDDLIAETDGSGQITRSYTWGAWGLISDYTPTPGNFGFGLNTPQGNTLDLLQDFLDLPGHRHSGLLHCQAGGGGNRYYAFDAQGSVSGVAGEGGQLLGGGCFAPFGNTNLSPYLQSLPFGYKAQGGAYRDSEVGPTIMMVGGGQAYAPSAPTYTAPVGAQGGNPYQPTANPVGSGAPYDEYAPVPGGPEDNGVNDNGSLNSRLTAMKGVKGLANHMEAGLDLASDFNPIYQWGAVLTGQTASGHKLSPGQRLFRLATLVAPALLHHVAENAGGVLSRLGRGAGAATSPCFVAGTLVQMADGTTKPIEQVKQGEMVFSRNEHSGQTEAKRVLKTCERQTDAVVSVTLMDTKTGQTLETITSSREHPFYVQGKGFVPAGGLAVGNAIVTRAGPALVVQAIHWDRQSDGYTVYNFLVEDDHTYFVGKSNSGIWVHNADCVEIASKITGKYGNLECKECAAALVKAFKKAGIEGEQLQIKGGYGKYIVSKTYGETPISDFSWHTGVKVGNTVFDNIHKTGIPFEEWLKDFDAPGGITLTGRTPF